MGLRQWITNAPTATYGPFLLRKDSIEKSVGEDKGKHSLEGVSAFVETGDELHRRITATRLVAVGVFALAFKKKSGGTSFLTIQGPDFAWVEEVRSKKRADAVKFAAKVRAAVVTAGAAPAE